MKLQICIIYQDFLLNEKYGEIDRVKFAASSKGLGVYDFIPIIQQLKKIHLL